MNHATRYVCVLALLTVGLCAEEKPAAPAKDEPLIRSAFLAAYQTAENTERKVVLLESLRGLKEKESLRLIAGMLGDRSDDVRKGACLLMADTTDPQGYFVKPLIGALTDHSYDVRTAAATALSSAKVRADAIKALTIGLSSLLGERPNRKRTEQEILTVCEAYNSALEKLTSVKRKEADIRRQSSVWMEFWKQNEELLRLADEKITSVEPPERPKNLPPDSFDK